MVSSPPSFVVHMIMKDHCTVAAWLVLSRAHLIERQELCLILCKQKSLKRCSECRTSTLTHYLVYVKITQIPQNNRPKITHVVCNQKIPYFCAFNSIPQGTPACCYKWGEFANVTNAVHTTAEYWGKLHF